MTDPQEEQFDETSMEDFPIGDRPRFRHVTASSMLQVALCPGSFQSQLQAPSDPGSADSNEGTLLHEALRCDDYEGLTDDQRETCFTARSQKQQLIEDYIGLEYDAHTERREIIRRALAPWLSGKYDWLATDGRRAIIGDYKMLFGDHVSAPYNLQLRALAVAVDVAWQESGTAFEEIRVAIVQPLRGAPSVAVYTREDLDAAREEIFGYVAAAYRSAPPVIVGERQCKYCTAMGHCPATRQALAKVATQPLYFESVDDAQLLEYYDSAGVAAKMIGMIKAETKRRLRQHLEDGTTSALAEELALKDVQGRREVTDSEEVYRRLVEGVEGEVQGLGAKAGDVFAPSVTVSLTKLEKAWRSAHPMGVTSTGRPKYITHNLAKIEIEKLTAGLVKRSEREPDVIRRDGMRASTNKKLN